MKRLRILTLFVFTLFINSLVAQTNFYYSGTGNGDDITNWWTNSNGTGSNPSNFTTINQVFRVQTGQNLSSFTGIWTVSGTNSKVVIENGGTLTGGSFNHVIKLDMEDNANYIASSSYTGLNFQSINANSNFKLNSTNLRTSLVYPNLIIDNNIIINPGSASLTINGNLQINSGSEFRGTATQTPTHTIGGNVIVQSGGIWTLSFGSTGVPIYNISGTISNLGTINAPSANGLSTINLVGSNSVTVNWGTKTGDKHNLTIASTKTIIFGDNLAVSSGTITADGIIDLNSKTISGAGSFTLSAGATLKTTNTGGINGSVSCSSKSFSTSANYIFNGTSAQIASTDLPATINSLTISNTSGLSLSANLAVTGSVTNTGILDAVTYTLSYGSISNSGATLRFSGVSNGFALNSGTIEYYGATQTIKNGNYSTLNITVAGNKTADGNITATTMDNGGNTNLASILDMAAYTFSVTTLDNAGATIKFSAATNAIAVSSGTIEYSGTTQTITSGTYNNLTISGTGTKTLAGSIIINNALTIGTGTDLNTSGSAYNIMVGNNWINNGSFTANSGTTTFNGTTTIMGSTSSFNNVTITGILTGSSSNMNVAGNWINNGTFNNNGGTVTFSGTTTISGSSSNTFKNIIITGSLTPPVSGINVAGDFTNNGTFNHNNGLVSFTGTGTISGSSTSTFNNLGIYGALTGSTGNMNIIGNWTQVTGSYSHNNGSVSFNGNSTQTIAGTNSFYNLIINKSSGGITLGSNNTSINGTLSLTNGIINAGAFTLNITNSAANAISGASSNSYVNGKLNRSIASGANTYAFPIGTATYAPVSIIFSSSNSGTLTATCFDGDSPNINSSNIIASQSVNRYWNFTKTGLSSVAYGASFNWDSADNDPGFLHASASCAKYDGTWTYPAISNRSTTGANISGATGFSDFEFGNENQLPVELSIFEAVKSDTKVKLNWQTVSERNNAKFIIERSADTKNFSSLAELKGAGNSNTIINYDYTDEFPLSGINYYRLKQVDFDGEFSYSIIRSVEFENNNTVLLFPTLVKNMLNIKNNQKQDSESIIQLITLANGIIQYQSNIPEGDTSKELDISDLPTGSYIARVITGHDVQCLKFIKL